MDIQVDITQVPAGSLSLASIEWAGAQPPITQAGCPPLEEVLSALLVLTSWSNVTLSTHHLALCIMLILSCLLPLCRGNKGWPRIFHWIALSSILLLSKHYLLDIRWQTSGWLTLADKEKGGGWVWDATMPQIQDATQAGRQFYLGIAESVGSPRLDLWTRRLRRHPVSL